MDITCHSPRIDGDRGNYNWPVKFDNTGPLKYTAEPGYIGITQFDESGKLKERVLLSPMQVEALIKFVRSIRREQ